MKPDSLLKKIVFINQDSGYLMIDIVNEYVMAGYKCVLITGRLIQRNKPLHASVKVERIITYNRNSTIKRLFTWLAASIQILFKVVVSHRNAELFIVSNPPTATLLPLWVRNPFTLLIFDIYPDALVAGKILKETSFIVKWWKNANKKVYSKAQRIFTLTETMGEVLQQYTVGKQAIVVPVWTDSTFLKPVAKENNPFIERHGLQGRFIVMYSGNLGYTHNVESIAAIAALVKKPAILFLIIGEGDGKESLAAEIKKLKLSNCLMLPWQPPAELPYSLSAADLAIVSSGSGASNLSIPSKTFNFMSVGAALLCLAPEDSELSGIVKRYENGVCFTTDQTEAIRDFIVTLAGDSVLLSMMKQSSLLASKDFGTENAKRFVKEKL